MCDVMPLCIHRVVRERIHRDILAGPWCPRRVNRNLVRYVQSIFSTSEVNLGEEKMNSTFYSKC